MSENRNKPGRQPGVERPALNSDAVARRVREMAEIARQQGLAELTVDEDGIEITVHLAPTGPVGAYPGPAAPSAPGLAKRPAETASPSEAMEPGVCFITAPMVGVFYRGPMPEAPPFVTEGDHIAMGDVVGIIEAMKIFNELQAEVSGELVEILVANEAYVALGQPLMKLRTTWPPT